MSLGPHFPIFLCQTKITISRLVNSFCAREAVQPCRSNTLHWFPNSGFHSFQIGQFFCTGAGSSRHNSKSKNPTGLDQDTWVARELVLVSQSIYPENFSSSFQEQCDEYLGARRLRSGLSSVRGTGVT